MAGPGVVESREQMETIAGRLAKRGVRVLRGGAFRTSDDPYGFQGLGEEGLKLLREVADRHQMLTHSTIFDGAQLPLRALRRHHTGQRARHAKLPLKDLAKLQPVMLRRGASSTIEEALMAADYLMRCGDHQVIVCERGIRTFETYTRHTLDLSAIPVIKNSLTCRSSSIRAAPWAAATRSCRWPAPPQPPERTGCSSKSITTPTAPTDGRNRSRWNNSINSSINSA